MKIKKKRTDSTLRPTPTGIAGTFEDDEEESTVEEDEELETEKDESETSVEQPSSPQKLVIPKRSLIEDDPTLADRQLKFLVAQMGNLRNVMPGAHQGELLYIFAPHKALSTQVLVNTVIPSLHKMIKLWDIEVSVYTIGRSGAERTPIITTANPSTQAKVVYMKLRGALNPSQCNLTVRFMERFFKPKVT